jgi:hypothetical protein
VNGGWLKRKSGQKGLRMKVKIADSDIEYIEKVLLLALNLGCLIVTRYDKSVKKVMNILKDDNR